MPEHDADRDAVEALRRTQGDDAFRELYRRHTPRLFAVAWRLTGGHRMNAEDIVQETWMRALAGLGSFRWQSALGSWLRGITVNVWRESVRGRDRELALLMDPAGDPAEPSVDLERAIARLPPGYRAVLVLHDIEGLTHQEIAEQLDLSIGTSKSQLFHARKSLKEWLENAHGRSGTPGR